MGFTRAVAAANRAREREETSGFTKAAGGAACAEDACLGLSSTRWGQRVPLGLVGFKEVEEAAVEFVAVPIFIGDVGAVGIEEAEVASEIPYPITNLVLG